jgi:tetratricopeptide (TPR) repeat protein
MALGFSAGWGIMAELGVLLLALAAGFVLARRGPNIFAVARSRSLGPNRTSSAGGRPFIGRERELDDFRRLILDPRDSRLHLPRGKAEAESESDRLRASASMLLVSGEPGIGKQALLQRFEQVCAEERRPARCAPVINLREPQRIADVLANIAEGLIEPQKKYFDRFERALERYRRVSRGERTRGQEGLDLTRTIASAGVSVIPGGERTANAIGSAAASDLVERWEGGSDVAALAEAFAQDLAQLANEDPRHRLVLFFADLDSRPNDRVVIWLRTVLFPKVLSPAVLVVASVTNGDLDSPGLAGIERLGQPAQMPLERFSDAEARRFVEEVIAIPPDSPLADTIVARSGGVLDRLQGYRRLVERNPHVRESERLPDDADAWASGGVTYSLLNDLPSRFLEQVVVTSSPLRWFNASLLEEVATEARLAPSKEEKGAQAADLIRWGTRPAWIVTRGNGWGVADVEHRRALVAEFRRLDPVLHRAVHRVACAYHRRQLVGEQRADSDAAAGADPFELDTPENAYENSEYVATLAEALYHMLAVEPDRAFPLVVRKGVEALFSNPGAAEQFVTIDADIHLSGRQRLYLDLLARSATALRENQQNDAIRVLEQLNRAGDPVPLVRPVVLHLLGRQYNWNGDTDRATRRFEAAHRLFGQPPLDSDTLAVRMRCSNGTWLAFTLASRDGVERRALERLDEASKLAQGLADDSLVAELARVRGVVQQQVGDRADARESFDQALDGFKATGEPDSLALVRRDIASLDRDEESYDDADRQLLLASGLYSSLADYESRARVEVERGELKLLRGREDDAGAHFAEARRLRTADAELENLIGNAYFSNAYWGDDDRYEQAIERYRNVLKLAPDISAYKRNLAHALFRVEQHEEADRIFEELLEADERDALTIRLFAESKRRRGDREGAEQLFNRLKSQKRRERDADPKRAGASWALGDLLYDWAGVLDGADQKRTYREAEREFARAVELDGTEPGYAFRHGQALVALGQIDQAVTVLRQAAEQAPGRDTIRQELVNAIMNLVPAERALAELRALLRRFPGDTMILEAYGRGLMTLSPDDRLGEVERELAEFPDEPELHFLRAKLLRARGAASQTGRDRFEQSVTTRALGGQKRASQPADRRRGSHESDVYAALRSASEYGEEKQRPAEMRLEYLIELTDFQIENRNWEQARQSARDAADLGPSDWRLQQFQQRIRFGDAWLRKVQYPHPAVVPVEVEVSGDLLPYVEVPGAEQLYDEMFPAMRERLTERWGMPFPGVRVRPNYDLPAATVAVYIREIPRYSFRVEPRCLAGASLEDVREAGVDGSAATRPWDGGSGAWIDDDDAERVTGAGIRVWDPRGVILSTIAAALERHAAEFVTLQYVAELSGAPVDGDGMELEARLSMVATLVRQALANRISLNELMPADGGSSDNGLDDLEQRLRSRLRSRSGVAAT